MAVIKEMASKGTLWVCVKRFLAVFLILVVLVGGVLGAIYYTEFKNEIHTIEIQEAHHANMQKELIEGEIRSVVSDLMVVSSHNETHMMLEGGFEGHRKALAKEFLAFSKSKGLYDQVRFLDETGKEVLRVNFNDGNPTIVPDEQLQSKGERDYFKDTFRLGRGEVYVSPFDLNIERGDIERPLKPVIRFGTPVFDSRGQKRGVIIINLLGAKLLHKLDKLSVDMTGKLMILNSEGYWLKGPKPEDEWGFMFDDKRDRTFKDAFPEAWQRVSGAESGQFTVANGMFSFSTVYPALKAKKSIAPSGEALKSGNSSLQPKELYWKVVSHVSPEILYAPSQMLLRKLLLLYAGLVVLLATGSGFLARAIVRRELAEEELRDHRDHLEEMVNERTAELEQAKEELEAEIAERKRSEEEVRLLQTMTLAISEAEDLESAFEITLSKVCETTEWTYGEAWIPRPDGTSLECSPAYFSRFDELGEFRSLTSQCNFVPGRGFPGRAWSSRKPIWVSDVTSEKDFVRAAVAKEVGIKGGMAIPVLADQEVVAVMVFFVFEEREEDERLVQLISSIAVQLGSVIKRKRAEEELRRVHRALKTLSHCNQAVVRVLDEPKLLNEICRIAVETGGYRLAWVGFAEQDEERSIRPVAQTGYEKGFLEAIELTWADTEQGRGPTGTAIRTGAPCMVQRILTDPKFEIFREEATERGYASAIALPLLEGERPFGALTIYAKEPGAFDKEEVELLEEMASDLAYGILAARTREARQRAEEETRLLQRMAFAVSDAEDFHAGLGVALRQVCEATGWAYGEAWVPSSDGTVLECSPAWHASVDGLEEFRRSSESFTFPMGEGLIGRAWSLKQPVWKTDVTVENGFVRTPLARGFGLKAGVAIPVLADDEVVAVMAFFVLESRQEDERLVGLVSTVATQLGSLMRRKQAEDALEKAYEELQRHISYVEKAQEQLIQTEKLAAVGQLTAGVSHEILNPLNVITMGLHLLLNNPDLPADIAEELRTFDEQAKRIIKISQNLLYFARQRPPEWRQLNLNEVVNKTIDLLEYDLKVNNIDVELNLYENLPNVLADQDQLQQVVLNLITNARDVMSDGGRLIIQTAETQFPFEAKRNFLELRVADTGPGIAPEHIEKVFDPFFTTKPEGKGTGLGLSICQGIIESHGGSLWAENIPDGGAAFIIRLGVEEE